MGGACVRVPMTSAPSGTTTRAYSVGYFFHMFSSFRNAAPRALGLRTSCRSMIGLPVCLLFAVPGWAQSQLPEVVVTANRSQQMLADALPHTTVLGRDVIDRSQAVDLPALLSREAGFQFTQNGGPGTSSNLFLRGSASLQVLVLVDGVPLTKQDTTGTVSLEHIMLDQVERVEVVRGNVSAIYGSGAIGGVIQIFTRQGQGSPKSYGSVEVGSYGSARAHIGISGSSGDTRYAIGVGRHTTRGFSANNTTQLPNENPDSDGFRNTNYSLSVSHDLAKGQTLGLRVQGSDNNFAFDGGGFGTRTDVYTGANSLSTWSLYTHNQVTANWRSELSWSQGREKSVYDARLTASPYDSASVSRTQTANWTNAIAIDTWLVTLGAERQTQKIDATDSFSTQTNRSRGVTSVFAGLSGDIGDHSLQLNARRDAADAIAAKSTVYAGYGFRVDKSWKVIASASTAFNLPPLGYLFDPFSGNSTLRPETARSTELGLQWSQDGDVLRATVFRTRIQDLLLYDFPTFAFNNVTSARNKGLELSYSGKVAGTDLRASMTLQDPIDESTGLRLVRRARTMASLGASRPIGPWTISADVRYTGARPDTTANPSLGAYTLVNLYARYALSDGLALTARIENLLDRNYQTAYSYNQPGRSYFVGLVWSQQ